VLLLVLPSTWSGVALLLLLLLHEASLLLRWVLALVEPPSAAGPPAGIAARLSTQPCMSSCIRGHTSHKAIPSRACAAICDAS
jgi:hypothetical protein